MSKKVLGAALLALALLVGAMPGAKAAAGTVAVAGDPTGDWIVVSATIIADGPARWGWDADMTRAGGPDIIGLLHRYVIGGRQSTTSHYAFSFGENRREVTTTKDLGGKKLVSSTQASSSSGGFGFGSSAYGFRAGDKLLSAIYVPGGTFSTLSARGAVNANIEITVGTGAGAVIADETSDGPGVHAFGTSGGTFQVRRTIPSGTLGYVLPCGSCRSVWESPTGESGGRVDTPNAGLADPVSRRGPAFIAPTGASGEWTFRMMGANVDPLSGRLVLASYVDLGGLRPLFV
jgi:hypothetical protein